jgi:hypothetical protein
MITNISQSA